MQTLRGYLHETPGPERQDKSMSETFGKRGKGKVLVLKWACGAHGSPMVKDDEPIGLAASLIRQNVLKRPLEDELKRIESLQTAHREQLKRQLE
jgi:hypothetical protein